MGQKAFDMDGGRSVSSRGRRTIGFGTWLALSALCLALAAPVSAAKPVRGCAGDFALMSIDAFRNVSLAVGVPPELLGEDWEAGLRARFDKNTDSMICVKDLPDTPGTLDGWIFNVVDNTSNHR